jgi:hypothetical protein
MNPAQRSRSSTPSIRLSRGAEHFTVKRHLPIPRALDGQLSRFRLPGPLPQRHSHRELELDHVIRGQATLQVGSRQVSLGTGSLVWIPPGCEHLVVSYSDDFEMWIASFRPRLVRRCAHGAEFAALRRRRGASLLMRRLTPMPARRLCSLLAEVSAYEEPAAYNAGLGHVLAQAWLLYRQAEASLEEISTFGDTIAEPGPLPS